MSQKIQTAIFDLESDGLLDRLTRIHILCVRDFERKETYTFRRNEHEDTIEEGLRLLSEADTVVGHNIIMFDLPAISKVYPTFELQGKIRDTLVMSRMVFADEKERDFDRFRQERIPGSLIGKHTLEAWGWRLKLHKGDYKPVKEKEAAALGITDPQAVSDYVWGTWNQEMEDYCRDSDIPITTFLWQRILAKQWATGATRLEHQIHDLMAQQERNGIFFDIERAQDLCDELKNGANKLIRQVIQHYGNWWAPAKKKIVKPLWEDPEGKNKRKKYEPVDEENGEDLSRGIWGRIQIPKRTITYKIVPGENIRAGTWEGAPFCPIVYKEFNPASRDHVIDRFTTVYNWHPVDFTETGRPAIDNNTLKTLAGHIPMAAELAEIFYYNKRLGQIATGAGAWLQKVDRKTSLIHAYVNVGGTISGRASHVSPNLAQVPKVKSKKVKFLDGSSKTVILKGREGDHGWECRNLFRVRQGWFMVGADLQGIELRCFGELLAKYDNGVYLEIVLSGDPHTVNMNLAGLTSRDQAKTFIYALIYGAGDIKLGSIVMPLADEETQRECGALLRQRFMEGLPAFARVTRDIKKMAAIGWMPGLDGRRLYVRSPHSALNTKLQSDAALIAKKWVCLTEENLNDQGLEQGWDHDFANLLWIHDEEQLAARTKEIAEIIAETCQSSALEAGRFFKFNCPITADSKIGFTWAQTH